MVTKALIDDFIAQKSLAIVGVSRSGKKFGNSALKELKSKGYDLHPIHPSASELQGTKAYPSFDSLPVDVGGVLIIVPPDQTSKVVKDAIHADISRIWIQQGAESEEAINFCKENGVDPVHGQCILMFAEPTGSFHKVHRWIWDLLGKNPK